MKGFVQTGIFALIISAFVGYVYLFEYVAGEKDKKAKEEAKKVIAWKSKDITKVTLGNHGKSTVLEKKEDRWYLAEPLSDLADESTMDTVLSTLVVEKAETVVAEAADLKEFGLDKPVDGLLVEKESGEKIKVLMSSVKSYDGNSYALKEGSPAVLLVSSSFADLAGKDLFSLRDKKVVRENLSDLNTIKMSEKKKTLFELTKDGNVWRSKNSDYPLNQAVVEGFIAKIQGIKAAEYVAEDTKSETLRKYLLKSGKHQLYLKKTDGKKDIHLKFSEKDGDSFVSTNQRDVISRIHTPDLQGVFVDEKYFKDKKYPFIFSKKDLTEIHWEVSGEKLHFVKDDSSAKVWILKEKRSDKKVADSAEVDLLIRDLEDLKVERFLSVKNQKQQKTSVNRVLLFAKDKVLQLEISWGKPFQLIEEKNSVDVVPMKSQKRSETFAVKESLIDKIEKYELLEVPEEKIKTTKEKSS